MVSTTDFDSVGPGSNPGVFTILEETNYGR